jgi:hypothetical protein
MAEANVRLRVDANQAVSSLRKVNNLVGQLGVALGAADLARRFFKGFAEADKAAAAVSTLGVNTQKLKAEPRNLSMDLFKHRMTARSLSGNMLHKLVGLLRLQQLLGLALVS